MKPSSYARIIALLLVAAGLSSCATSYMIRTEPSDASIALQNISTGEVFRIGTGIAKFGHDPAYGAGGFMIMASKKGYETRKLFVPNVPGSATEFMLTLRPDFTQTSETPKDPAELFKQMVEELKKRQDEMEARLLKKQEELEARLQQRQDQLQAKLEDKIVAVQDDLRKQQQENWMALLDKMKKVDDEHFAATSEKLRTEAKRDADAAHQRVAVLENTFGVYKDALFSERYSRGPASYDRGNVDEKVAMLTKIQQLVELRHLTEADDLVAKLIIKDEYMPQAYTIRGTIRYLQNKLPEAIASWERALEIDPSQMLTRRYLAEAYRKSGRAVPADLLPEGDEGGSGNGGRSPASVGSRGPSSLPPRVRMRNY